MSVSPARPFIRTVTLTTGAIPERVIPEAQFLVLAAQFQNLSTEVVNLATSEAELRKATIEGFRLNPASIAGQGGGTVSMDGQGTLIDLSVYFFVRATAGLTLAVHVIR